MPWRRWILLTHRWLGLSSSLVLAIVGFTGAVLVVPDIGPMKKIFGVLHERLALGHVGWMLVVLATVVSVFLEVGGIILWWKRKQFSVRLRSGWQVALSDLHHPVGVIGLLLMLWLSISGVGMAYITPGNYPALRQALFPLHTTRDFGAPLKALYAAASLLFVVQGVTGFVMWWKPGALSARRPTTGAQTTAAARGR